MERAVGTSARTTVAVFDFDGTITDRDATVAFCFAVVPPARLASALLRQAPRLAGCGLGLVPRERAKEALLTALFRGVDEACLRLVAAVWAGRELPGMVRPTAMDRVRWHQARGHRVVLCSASLALFLEPWARAAGIDDVLATRMETRDGRLTGRLDGRNCYGAEKVARLRALIGDLAAVDLYAYGDSRGDRELLAAARHAVYRPFRRQ
jgi:phosphatidylglycerophosphatase C